MSLSGSLSDYLWVFLGGVMVSFTPCIYPLIPITVGYIGVSSRGSKFLGFLLSLIYVTGIAITYSFLGLVASLTGRIFGEISTHPFTYIGVGLVVVFFGLGMLEFIPIPYLNLSYSVKQRRGYLGTFILGLSSGLTIGPCLSPVLGAILAYLATKRNILYGMSLLFSFAFGLGLSLMLIATFGVLLINLPKPGRWMVYVKRIAGIILLGMGLYFIFNGIERMG
ncbi:MAG: sulfite exporter TauE/SafE family protein [Candidatus Omnitrophica bacterium]|nr:sulfite exporter TauE/SafE family protein [Candidatus Omnitrophota bacterium]